MQRADLLVAATPALRGSGASGQQGGSFAAALHKNRVGAV
jgi:hypothetical protein